MTVRYVRVNPVADLFAPAVRAYGNVAIVGTVTPPNPTPPDLLVVDEPVVFTDPAEARRRAPGPLGDAIALAFAQSPGPMQVTGVRVDDAAPDWATSLAVLATKDVQIVALADEPLDAASGANDGSVRALADHVVSVSNTGGDGLERIGVAMLAKGATDPTIVSGALASERHGLRGPQFRRGRRGSRRGHHRRLRAARLDAVQAGHRLQRRRSPPRRSVSSTARRPSTSGPAGKGVNWLVDPPLIPGQAVLPRRGLHGQPPAARSTSTSSARSTTSPSCSRRASSGRSATSASAGPDCARSAPDRSGARTAGPAGRHRGLRHISSRC